VNEILESISKFKVVPVVVLEDAKDAIPLGRALSNGGLKCAEITFRTEAAEESIRLMSNHFPDMLIGAGTVLTTEQVDKAVAAGAKFIVSPGLNPKVVQYCIDKDIVIVPGVTNPSGIEQALELGLEVVKFFPAEANGGLNAIKAMAGPFPKLKFMPTGGISENNIGEYLSFSKIVACGGTWMVKESLIKNGEYEKIEELTREAIKTVFGFQLKHVGVNCEDEGEANASADKISDLFGFQKRAGNSSIFTDDGIEFMKAPYLGKKGHIAIGTNDVLGAMKYLESLGVTFNKDSEKYKNDKLIAVYLEEEISGFAIHLVQN
jgi:2-dehydro-3-deoxyphosphogluconate aldolase/(4S)-4-hydroxy-2-oxoglutarate aldolase